MSTEKLHWQMQSKDRDDSYESSLSFIKTSAFIEN